MSKLATTALGRDGPVEPQIAVSDSVVSTLGGQELRIFAKSSTGSDGDNVRMWEDVVEQGLKEPMLVQVGEISLSAVVVHLQIMKWLMLFLAYNHA